MKEINNKQFLNEIKSGTSFVDFSATWCGPCKLVTPMIEKAEKDTTGVKFFKIDIDKEPNLTKTYNITSVPTMIMFKDGTEVSRTGGFLTNNQILDFINKNK